MPTPTSKIGTSSSKGGFTFIELAIVLLLLGILMVFAIPRFAQVAFQGSSKAAARRMYGVIATVHDKAALQKRRYWLGMELGSGEYWAAVTEPAQALGPEDVLRLKDDAVLDGLLPGEVIFTDVVLESERLEKGTALAVFEPNGTCTGAQIHLEDDRGGVSTLMVNPLTGRCAVYDSYLLHQGGEEAGEGAEEGFSDQEALGEEGWEGEEPAEEGSW